MAADDLTSFYSPPSFLFFFLPRRNRRRTKKKKKWELKFHTLWMVVFKETLLLFCRLMPFVIKNVICMRGEQHMCMMMVK